MSNGLDENLTIESEIFWNSVISVFNKYNLDLLRKIQTKPENTA